MANRGLRSLEWMAYASFAVNLWKQDGAVNAASTYCLPHSKCGVAERKSSWRWVEDVVIQTMRSLQVPVPGIVSRKALEFIHAVGWEIAMWMWHVREITDRDTWRPVDVRKISFTSEGCVDRRLSAVAIVEDTDLDIRQRYVLACVYCLEDHVKALSAESSYINFRELKQPANYMCEFWANKLGYTCRRSSDTTENEQASSHECSTNAQDCYFRYSVYYGLGTASRFFWKKLFPDRSQNFELRRCVVMIMSIINIPFSSVKTDVQEYYCDTFLSLFFDLNEEERNNILERVPVSILECCLYWPRQSLFVDILNRAIKHIDVVEYINLLTAIMVKINYGYKDFDYEYLFIQYCNASKLNKTYSSITSQEIMDNLFNVMDTEIIYTVLRSFPPQDKRDIFETPAGKFILRKLEYEGQEELLEFITNLCTESQTPVTEPSNRT